MTILVPHRWITVAGVETFYREAGREDAPVLLLPHGYPCSSYEFRNLMPRLADRWRLIAPDFPGAGYSGTPDDFDYSFDGYAAWLEAFVDAMHVDRFVLYLHDFGSPIGARLAIRTPQRIAGLIIQNGDIPYEDALGPKYADIEATWTLPRSEMRRVLAEAISEENFKEEFLNDLPPPWPIRSSRSLEAALVADHAAAQGNCHRPDRRTEGEPGLVSGTPQILARIPAAHLDRLGSQRPLHAGKIGAGLSARSAGCRTPSARRRALAARDASR